MLPSDNMSFLVRAVNTAVDSDNRIHDDRVAAEYGFSGGLVPGVTIYGYMTSAVIAHLGEQWLQTGAMDVRFFEPFYEGEQVAILIADLDEGRIKVEAGSRASGTAWVPSEIVDRYPAENRALIQKAASRETIRPGVILGTIEKTLDLSTPGMAAPLDAFIGEYAHPAILLALANEILLRNFVLGPWIHASSEVRNASAARDGETVEVRGEIVDAYERKGHEFVVLNVAILSGERLISTVRHTAIWQPRKVR
jgi:hypothetical protein